MNNCCGVWLIYFDTYGCTHNGDEPSKEAISITYCEFGFVVLVIQRAMRMRHIILSPVACLVVPYPSTLS